MGLDRTIARVSRNARSTQSVYENLSVSDTHDFAGYPQVVSAWCIISEAGWGDIPR